MFQLLQGVPVEQMPYLGIPGNGLHFVTTERPLGEDRRHVFGHRGEGQVSPRGQHVLKPDQPVDLLLRVPPRDGVTHLDQLLVDPPVLLSVHRLLSDEACDTLFEHWIGDLVGELAHRTNEAFFTGRETTGQSGHEMAVDDVVFHEVLVGVAVVAEAESDPPGLRVRRSRARHFITPL
ncbi:Uncharacterised protein [Mycobacteroides abscessus subsp. abscessus]|nr:Uncharacterised protein [Mycobacteroides abscessus subsp. abscessus]